METSLYEDSFNARENMNDGESSQNNNPPSKPARPTTLSTTSASANGGNGSGAGTGTTPKNLKDLKKTFSLDFTSPQSAKKTLATPDILNLFRLTSPELEKLITQGSVSVSTPTPTQFLFPKKVTTEQENYARGFLDALTEIQRRNGFVPVPTLLSPGFIASGLSPTSGASKPVAASTTSSSGDSGTTEASSAGTSASVSAAPPAIVGTATTAPGLFQIVQSPTKAGGSPGTSVIMQTVGFPNAFSINATTANFFQQASQSAGSISAAMALMSQSYAQHQQASLRREEERPPSQSAEGGSMEFTTLAQAQPPAAASNFPMTIGGHPPPNAGQFVELTATAQSSPAPSSVGSSETRGSSRRGVKEEQTVPNILGDGFEEAGPGPSTGGGGIMDMNVQETLKLERKRQRNRVAATKCRKRKLERITFLEAEVKKLEEVRADLDAQTQQLHLDTKRLRTELQQHRQLGCNLKTE